MFPDEYHSRLRFKHRGLVASAGTGSPNTNGSQFFITLDRCDWLDKKHTIFGKVIFLSKGLNYNMMTCVICVLKSFIRRFCFCHKIRFHFMLQVTGDSVYNLLRIGEVETDKDDRPVDDPPKVLSVEVYISLVWNSNFPFSIQRGSFRHKNDMNYIF